MIEDYSYLSMEEVSGDGFPQYDIFLSAYNKAERVQTLFNKCNAVKKHWLITSEYGIEISDYPLENNSAGIFRHTIIGNCDSGLSEILNLWDKFEIIPNRPLCIDATGFLRPVLLFLMLMLYKQGIKKYDVLYAEPSQYINREQTIFTEEIFKITQILGFRGNHIQENDSQNLLIIGAGYENELIAEVAKKYENFREKVLIYGFPPLQADMFQESILRVSQVEESVGVRRYNAHNAYFASANDPFTTANTLRQIVRDKTHNNQNWNLYLSPLSSKPQVLGFGLYYINEWLPKKEDNTCSIVFPFASRYSSETSSGIGRIWRYTIETPD